MRKPGRAATGPHPGMSLITLTPVFLPPSEDAVSEVLGSCGPGVPNPVPFSSRTLGLNNTENWVQVLVGGW